MQLGNMNQLPVPPRMAGGHDQGIFIGGQTFITQVGRVMRKKSQAHIQSTLLQCRLDVIGGNFRDGQIDIRMLGGEKPQ